MQYHSWFGQDAAFSASSVQCLWQKRRPMLWQSYLLVIALLVMALMTGPALAASANVKPSDRPPLRIITVDERPSAFIQDGQLTGFVFELVQALQNQLGDHSPIELLPEDQALQQAHQYGNALLFSFSRTPARESEFHWLLPVLQKRWLVMTREPKPALRNLAQLRKLTAVGVVRGDIRETFLLHAGLTNLRRARDHQQNLLWLHNGEVEAIATDSLAVALPNGQNQPLSSAFELQQSEVYLVMPKTADQQLYQRCQHAILQLQQQGTLEKIAIRWQQRLQQQSTLTVNRAGIVLQF